MSIEEKFDKMINIVEHMGDAVKTLAAQNMILTERLELLETQVEELQCKLEEKELDEIKKK